MFAETPECQGSRPFDAEACSRACPARAAGGLFRMTGLPKIVIESSERPTIVVGRNPYRKSRFRGAMMSKTLRIGAIVGLLLGASAQTLPAAR